MTEPELRGLMNRCALSVQAHLREATGVEKPLFVLLAFDDPKVSQYVASAERASVIEALREAADRLEAGEDVTR